MRDLRGATALVTGASGGIGRAIARGLAAAGTNVVVSGRREDALAELVDELQAQGVRAAPVPADLTDLAQCEPLIRRAEAAIGPLDVLINNAGVEHASAFALQPAEELTATVNINLAAPLLLTRAVVEGMLERGRGHVVFISSVAGKVGPPYQAAYGASKAGLVGLSQSLRAEYVDAPVGFSVICPGFVAGDGMYQRMVDEGFASNRIMGSTTLDKVTAAVLRAIQKDVPEIVVNNPPMRPLLVLAQVAPRLSERMAPRVGLTELFRRVAASRGRVP
jgi:short-subunit dehydrogenase